MGRRPASRTGCLPASVELLPANHFGVITDNGPFRSDGEANALTNGICLKQFTLATCHASLAGGMPRKPSIGPSTTSPFNTTPILVHKTTESHAFASSYTPKYSLQTLVGTSATPQQKIVDVLVNRLRNKVL